MKQENKKSIIVVLGMHRSGTSAVACGLQSLGVDLGNNLTPPLPGNNEKGFFEDIDIAIFDEELLHYLGHDWQTLTSVQRSELERDDLASFKLRAVELLRGKLKGKTVFGLKDPRVDRLLPFWKIVFEHLGVEVSYVIAIRHPLSVAGSLNKRDGFELEKSSYLWLCHVVPSMLNSEGSPRVVVDYDLLMVQPEKQLCRIAEALSLPFDASSPITDKYVKEFLTEDLRHTQFHVNDFKFAPEVPQDVVEAYIILDKLARDQVAVSSEEVHDSFARLYTRLNEMRPAFNYITKRDVQLTNLGQALVERDVQLTNLGQALVERDGQLANLGQALVERDGQLTGLSQALAERDLQFTGLSQALAERDVQLAGLSQALAERDLQLTGLSQALAERDVQLGRLETNAGDLEDKIQALQHSNSWKITAPLRFVSAHLKELYQKSGSSLRDDCDSRKLSIPVISALKKAESHREKKHNYDYEVDLSSDTAPAKVVRLVGHNKRVLEIGAGPGSITKILKQNNGCRITGVEIDPSAIAKLSEFCEVVHQCNLNVPEWATHLSGCGTFDVIVAADVFEHLNAPKDTLATLKPFLSPNGYLVISLPHIGNNAIIASILDSDFEYRDWGLLDRTHIRFFGIRNMQELVDSAGYKIMAAEFVINPPEQTELAAHWQKLPDSVKSLLAHNQYGTVYQVVMKIVPAASAEDGIQLTDLPVPKYTTTAKEVIKARLRRHMSPKVRLFFSACISRLRD